jgi:hypothetical protein
MNEVTVQAMTHYDPETETAPRSLKTKRFSRESIAHPTEISDTDLEKVAGGTSAAVVTPTTALVVTAILIVDRTAGW